MIDIQKNFPLNTITTLEIGGPAKELVTVKNIDELKEALNYATEKSLDYLIVGGGSNLLISDEGFNGLVIKNEISGITLENGLIKAAGGTPLQDLVDYSIEHGLAGLQKLTGIPGTVGGAVYGNAGAYGQTISDCLEKVICLNPTLSLQVLDPVEDDKISLTEELTKEDCNFSYRDSAFKENGLAILEICFSLPEGNTEELRKESSETLEKRLLKYKPGIKCPGSFFKNVLMSNLTPEQKELIPPERDTFGKVPAWFFLDEVGARNSKKGAIEVADFHGNLFVNSGGGTAGDFYDLAKELKDKVKDKFGINLEPEVQLINLPEL